MKISPKKCLIVSPHTDDGEFGCGASISKLIQNGTEVHYLAFSICEESVPPQYNSSILKDEVQLATSLLGIKSQNLHIQDFKVRYFPENRQKILQVLVDYNKDFKPDLVICPASDDVHQDHHAIYEECLRAFKKTTLLGYELPWNNTHFATDSFIQISENNLKTKITAIQAYKSQSHRNYINEDFIRSLAVMRGIQAGFSFAESFEIIRLSWD
jgi:LmbE family N-acetylglucosaminyl deacetylase